MDDFRKAIDTVLCTDAGVVVSWSFITDRQNQEILEDEEFDLQSLLVPRFNMASSGTCSCNVKFTTVQGIEPRDIYIQLPYTIISLFLMHTAYFNFTIFEGSLEVKLPTI